MAIICTIFASIFAAENTWDLYIILVAFLVSHAKKMFGIHWLDINVIHGSKSLVFYFILELAINSKLNAWYTMQ